ncbi:MAG: exo-beta-N-acetylmuramidase NamZ domain-containing protein [Bacteroidota bacterium]
MPISNGISLYNSTDHSLTASREQLAALDTIIIDIQDAGSRYYTYTVTVWLLLQKITALHLDLTIIVLDKPNPAGRQVEGTRINNEYASFIGLEGLPHRHGLTIAELCNYFREKLQGKWELIVSTIRKKEIVFIPPSPNIPSVNTCWVYSGQCLWEGTNISEGRGTTLPFETIGAPFLNWVFAEDWNAAHHSLYNKNCYIRPLLFIPRISQIR